MSERVRAEITVWTVTSLLEFKSHFYSGFCIYRQKFKIHLGLLLGWKRITTQIVLFQDGGIVQRSRCYLGWTYKWECLTSRAGSTSSSSAESHVPILDPDWIQAGSALMVVGIWRVNLWLQDFYVWFCLSGFQLKWKWINKK